eukprot:s2862_g3.t1
MFKCLGCCVREPPTDCDNSSSEPESSNPSAAHTDDQEYEYDLKNPHDFIQFLIDAKIRLVSLRYLMDLQDAGRVWPRRQEAEQDLVPMEEIENLKQAEVVVPILIDDPIWGAGAATGLAFRRQGKSPVRIYSVSHCWEAQQHPDPLGFQCSQLLNWFRCALGFHAAGLSSHPDSTWLFIDYICLPQYKRTEE